MQSTEPYATLNTSMKIRLGHMIFIAIGNKIKGANMLSTNKVRFASFMLATSALGLSGCMSKGIEMTEQQQRMQRCDQYIEMARDQCLRGDNVTIEDYKEEYREFEKDTQERMRAETQAIEKAVAAQEKIKAEKLKQALKDAEEKAKKAQEQKVIEQ